MDTKERTAGNSCAQYRNAFHRDGGIATTTAG